MGGKTLPRNLLQDDHLGQKRLGPLLIPRDAHFPEDAIPVLDTPSALDISPPGEDEKYSRK